ncbi:MAG TPA: transglycosylase SLT domain-containing protein [Stellaceae bacterium]|nr:transglycosylase SLT domain-containing protein [Stellaceae bacterium]
MAAADRSGVSDPDVLNTINHMLCRMIESSAHSHGLPVDFLTRLVWQESRFRTGLVSPAGAQGIAQFMPQTAAARGLTDPFAPEAAIGHAAALLAALDRQFGNVGLAAAAYNAGAARVSKWLQGQAALPLETQNYVRLVTGRTADEWAAKARGSVDRGASAGSSCIVLTADLRHSGSGPLRAWQAPLNGTLAPAAALISAYEHAAAPRPSEKPPLPSVLLPQPAPRAAPDEGPPPPSAAAEEFCDSTRSLGISCAVYTR